MTVTLFTKRSQNLDIVYPEKFFDVREAMRLIYEEMLHAVKRELIEVDRRLYLNHKVTVEIEWKSEIQGGFKYIWVEANALVEEENVR